MSEIDSALYIYVFVCVCMCVCMHAHKCIGIFIKEMKKLTAILLQGDPVVDQQ